jgi:hypothetical protein
MYVKFYISILLLAQNSCQGFPDVPSNFIIGALLPAAAKNARRAIAIKSRCTAGHSIDLYSL